MYGPESKKRRDEETISSFQRAIASLHRDIEEKDNRILALERLGSTKDDRILKLEEKLRKLEGEGDKRASEAHLVALRRRKEEISDLLDTSTDLLYKCKPWCQPFAPDFEEVRTDYARLMARIRSRTDDADGLRETIQDMKAFIENVDKLLAKCAPWCLPFAEDFKSLQIKEASITHCSHHELEEM